MSINDGIQPSTYPLTSASLAARLRACGLAAGQTVLVHMAMSKLGWVVGGAEAVILAFLEVLGESGTLMMPTHTTDNTDPQDWQNPPVPPAWWPLIREHTPGFNPATTPTVLMGRVAELFRIWPGARRSAHPVTSFAARGPNAAYLTADHPLEDETGDGSPLGKLYALDGHVLLLGVDHRNNTSLHLAEARADYPGKKWISAGSAILVDGQRRWVTYRVLATYDQDFNPLGEAFDEAFGLELPRIGRAEVRFFSQRNLVDFAVGWMEKYRNLTR